MVVNDVMVSGAAQVGLTLNLFHASEEQLVKKYRII